MESPGQKYWSISHTLPCGVPVLSCDFQGIVAVLLIKANILGQWIVLYKRKCVKEAV